MIILFWLVYLPWSWHSSNLVGIFLVKSIKKINIHVDVDVRLSWDGTVFWLTWDILLLRKHALKCTIFIFDVLTEP
jgi:hypothetical protein